MRKFLLSVLTVSLLSSFAFAGTDKSQVDWALFGDNLETSLKSENIGVKLSAMQLIIEYSADLDVAQAEAVYVVMHEFRNNTDQSIRKLSLITLYKMNNDWAIHFLKRHHKFEENKEIKNTIQSIVAAYENGDNEKITKTLNESYLSLAF
jgi:hypothetical protein